jgi:hypothetical protein
MLRQIQYCFHDIFDDDRKRVIGSKTIIHAHHDGTHS